jgi:hypothetical protein
MKHELKVGDNVEWKSEGARARGMILKKIISPLKFHAYTVQARRRNPNISLSASRPDWW